MKSIIISASDPGGANALLPLLGLLSKDFELHLILGGAARDIFKKSGIDFIDGDKLGGPELKKLVEKLKPELFLAGSSFGYTIDKKIFELVKNISPRLIGLGPKIKTFYILDFWSNYWQRFSDKAKDFKYLPDLICVMDNFAKREMIKEGFAPRCLVVTGNPFFDSFTKGVRPELEEKNRLLFVSQPYSDGPKKVATNFGYDEFEVLNDVIGALNGFENYKLFIRPHPKENPKKFNSIIKKSGNIFLDKETDVKNSIARAGLVIGMNSAVLLQAALGGRPVISYQPGLKKGADVLISNKLGLSLLVTDRAGLEKILGNYFGGKNVIMNGKSAGREPILVKGAVKRVIKLLKKYV